MFFCSVSLTRQRHLFKTPHRKKIMSKSKTAATYRVIHLKVITRIIDNMRDYWIKVVAGEQK